MIGDPMFSPSEKFCGNPTCPLHVSPNDRSVEGQGNWAEVNGITFGREKRDGVHYCHVCAVDPDNPPCFDSTSED